MNLLYLLLSLAMLVFGTALFLGSAIALGLLIRLIRLGPRGLERVYRAPVLVGRYDHEVGIVAEEYHPSIPLFAF